MVKESFPGEKAFRQIMELYITPEVLARQEAGTLPTPVALNRAQVFFCPFSENPIIRINEECEIVLNIKKKIGIKYDVGDPVYIKDVLGVESVVLEGTEFEDCGHITIVTLGEERYFIFDSRQNKKKAKETAARALEFLTSAELSLHNCLYSAFVDGLYSSCELSLKSFLMSMASDKGKTFGSHRAITTEVHRWFKMRTINSDVKEAFNHLGQLRYKARYLKDNYEIEHGQALYLFQIVKESVFRNISFLS